MADIAEVDQLHDQKEFSKIYDILQKAVVEDKSEDAELLWRFARANFDKMQELSEGDKERENYAHSGREIAEKAVSKDSSNWACHKWMAIMLSKEVFYFVTTRKFSVFNFNVQGDFVPKKQKIQNAFKVKEHADKAIELNPEDGTTLHFLGRFAFTIAGISWMERKVAATLMASPPTATYEEALDYFIRADEKRKFIQNQLWIAKTYLKLGNKAKAKEWFTTVVNTESTCESDNFDIEEAKQALKKL